ncbi:M24 family metallopeptidase, partial [Bacillus pumilus]|uniref:M24 family metallopeptidase n=1 Tax=Bacillus pumilus TaxID=1408 RepID=UPI0016429B2C
MGGVEMSKGGVRIGEVELKGGGVMRDGGYGEYFGEGVGDGVGVCVDEFAWMSEGNDDVVEEGMVYRMEAG